MKIIKPCYEILSEINREDILKRIESAGRICYKSENKITEDSSSKFVKMVVNRGHLSVIEHISLTVKFICDRGVSHELVRHRLASFSQESTRYCNYSKDKFGSELTFIEPCFFEGLEYVLWKQAMEFAEKQYFLLLEKGAKPEEARSVLPNSLKTELVMTANLREWKHILKLRTSKASHSQMQELMIPLYAELRRILPEIF